MKILTKTIELSFYFFVFLLPWQTQLIWREAHLNGYIWHYGRLSLFGTQIFLWLILFLYGFWLFKTQRLKKLSFDLIGQRIKQPKILLYWLVVIFLLYAGLSVIWSPNSSLAYYRWFTLIQAVALFSLICNFPLSFKKLAFSWVAAGIIQGILAIIQFFSQSVLPNKWFGLSAQFANHSGSIILQTPTERWLRAYGSLPHPNVLAGFLVIGLFFTIYLALTQTSVKQKIFIFSGLISQTAGLFFSFSRSAWLAFAICLLVFLFIVFKERGRLDLKIVGQIFFLIIIVFTILSFIFSSLVTARVSGDQELEMASIKLRLDYTHQAYNLFVQAPIRGFGLGNYTLAVYQNINGGWPGYYYQPVHNIYLLILSELGLIGFCLFGLILFLLIGLLIKTKATISAPHLWLEKIILLLGLLVILIISLLDHYYWTHYFGVMVFWLILGFNFRYLLNVKERG